ncbi:hypothetical protein RN346_10195 [Halomonas sp. PAMB 3232]|uniref:hypothetical protein n=1 Tax=Halomonas sp. PAMB 3232 TaxID=3075221 RepID=UPI00289C206A|nr:hypothetical protein [Halomonas sp. PAMB 3232]WNL37682.1 hypothetical protein RN346_10195 [Halomonas sp. PAMB 3232]
MSHIQVRKTLGGKMQYAGREWWYDFHQIPGLFEEKIVFRRAQKLMQQFAPITKSWNADLNSEWTVRAYFSAKMVLAASVMAQSLRYAEEHNLRAVTSYLSYYTVMHSLRAIAFTSPNAAWNDGELLMMTHSKTINVACDEISQFNRDLSGRVKQAVLHLKAFRELISYRAPSSGDRFPRPNFDIYEYSRCFLEVAQLQSELLEASIEKNVTESFELQEKVLSQVTDIEMEGVHFHDKEDWYRLEYLARKHPRPTNILHIMSEGHVEDFFGSWCADDENEDSFDPDEDWRILFDVP